jgi:hypothetical protein
VTLWATVYMRGRTGRESVCVSVCVCVCVCVCVYYLLDHFFNVFPGQFVAVVLVEFSFSVPQVLEETVFDRAGELCVCVCVCVCVY